MTRRRYRRVRGYTEHSRLPSTDDQELALLDQAERLHQQQRDHERDGDDQ